MTILIPTESLEQILCHFKDDKVTLHSCVLVNRFWCSTAASILYKRPFQFLSKPSPKLIRTFISCLSPSSKDSLIQARINPKILDLPSPKLHYPSFLRHLNYEFIYNSIFELFKEISEKSITQQDQNVRTYKHDTSTKRLLTIEIFKLIVSSTPVIKHLVLDIQHIQDVLKGEFFHFDNDIKSILNSGDSKICLSQIKR